MSQTDVSHNAYPDDWGPSCRPLEVLLILLGLFPPYPIVSIGAGGERWYVLVIRSDYDGPHTRVGGVVCPLRSLGLIGT